MAGFKNLAALSNPISHRTGDHPQEWYHGSPHAFEHFDDPAHFQMVDLEAETGQFKHWNTLVGNHFTSDHALAKDFSGGEHTPARDWEDDYEGPMGHVVHVKLHMKNPKVYASEHDMDQEVYEHEWEQGNHHDRHNPPPGLDADEDEYEMWEDEMGHRRHFAGDSKQKYKPTDPDPTYAYSFHPKATGWLNTHPDKEGIAQRYKDRLKRNGYDGVIYGNEYEHSSHGKAATSAIAFEPHQIEITQHHYGKENCLSEEEAKRRTPPSGQMMLPGTEEYRRKLPKERPIDTSKHWPRTWTPSFFDNKKAARTADSHDTGRLWAPLPKECWDRYYGRKTSARTTLHGPFFHGTASEFQPGDLIDPERELGGRKGKSYAYMTLDPEAAHNYGRYKAQAQWVIGNDDAEARAYEVEPTGPIETDDTVDERFKAWRSKHPLKVVREIRPGHTAARHAASADITFRTGKGKRQGISHTTVHAYIGDEKVGSARMIDNGRTLDELYVKPEHRGKGVAQALMGHVVDKFGHNTLDLYASPFTQGRKDKGGLDTDALRGFYNRYGFESDKQDSGYMVRQPHDPKTAAIGEESARQDAGRQQVWPVASEGRVESLCAYHKANAESYARHEKSIADRLDLGTTMSGELGGPQTGTCSACTRQVQQTNYQLKTMLPRSEQSGKSDRQPRRQGRPYVPSKTKPLPTLRQSLNAAWDDDEDEQPEECEECYETHTPSEGHRECNACGERHEEYEDKMRHESTMTDWDEVYPSLNSHVHRVLPRMELPSHVHDVVHDESRPMEERGKTLLDHVQKEHGRHGLGMHWSDVFGEGRGYGADKFAGVGGGAEHETQVVLHARKPEREDIETDPDTLDDHQVYGYHEHDENEVPIQRGAPVHLTGISWRPGGFHQEWRHHNLKEPIEMTASKKLPTLRMLAHDATENQAIRHCPFCGSGKVIGRQDGSVECEFCHGYFTVQVQPQYPNFPQTVNGVPQDIPGMPGQVEQPVGMGGGLPPGQEGDGDGNPFADDGQDEGADGFPPDQDAADDGQDEEPPPFAKKSFRTATGARLSEDDYVNHLAIALALDRGAMIERIRRERGA